MSTEYTFWSAEEREKLRKPCVYFAYEPGTNNLLYVGCSDSIRRPFQPNHKKIGNIKCDIFITFFKSYRKALAAEKEWIAELKPKLNCLDHGARVKKGLKKPGLLAKRNAKIRAYWKAVKATGKHSKAIRAAWKRRKQNGTTPWKRNRI